MHEVRSMMDGELTFRGRPLSPGAGLSTQEEASSTTFNATCAESHATSHERPKMKPMAQADTDNTSDNVTQFPGATPETPRRHKRRSKDRTGAARQAKFRSRNKGDRYETPTKDAPSSPHVDAPPTVTPAARNGVTVDAPNIDKFVDISPADARASAQRHGRGIRFVTLTAALGLATVSGGFSITGMTSIFVGAYWPVVGMGLALEVGKLAAVAWLGHQRGMASWRLRAALAVLIAVLMGLNAIGCYGFLAKANIGHQIEGETAVGARLADVEARLSVRAETIADLTKQIADLDAARTIETPSAGNLRTASAISAQAAALAAATRLRAADDERRQTKRTSLADKLTVEAKALADLKIDKARVDGDKRVAEADLGPVRYLATLLGASDQDVLRWFILVVSLLLDPAAVLLLLAATRR
jgi:hypothetical protein